LLAAVRARVLEVDPQQPVYHTKSMDRLLDDSLLARSSAASLVGGFSLIALLLALLGVYGVVSYGVTQQMPEFGIRLALGATPSGLVGLVLRQTAMMTAAGIVLGAAAAAAAGNVLERLMLYGVGGRDLVAGAIPAWRAASAEPLRALRQE
jgi:ABC-type antimicrobial peptide transport system permease subunit